MKTYLTTSIAIITLLLISLLCLAYYLGAFIPMSIQEQETGPFILLYQETTTHNMKTVGLMTSNLDKLIAKEEVSPRQPFDIFYPDGHAEVGFAVNSISVQQLSTISLQAKLKQIPVQHSMVLHFPWHNELSFVVGYFKANNALNAYRKTHGYKQTEAYVLNSGNSITYIQPILR